MTTTTTDHLLAATPDGPAPAATDPLEAEVGAFAERLFEAGIGAMELLTIHLGDRLGLYRALHDHGPATPAELAAAAGIDTRYAQEWLEQQCTAGVVTLDAPSDAPESRRYALPPSRVPVLIDEASLAYLAPLGAFTVGSAGALAALAEAYRRGTGMAFGAFGEEIRRAQAAMNRPHFANLLAADWLPTMPDVVARLEASPALVADVGCGCGWASIALAEAFPKAEVHGFDLDEASVVEARANARRAGLGDRVTFEVRDATSAAPGAYDLVCMFEALHDTGRPVDVLSALRVMAGPDGAVLVMDERVADGLTPDGGPVERFLFAASVLHCLAVGRSDEHHHATGTMLRAPLLHALADRAGFRSVEELPIEHDFWRFYRLGA